MKIDGINHDVISFYKKNTAKAELKAPTTKKDTIELSTLGKSLSALSLEDQSINSKEKIESIRNEINKGTYKVDSKLIANKMFENMKGRDI